MDLNKLISLRGKPQEAYDYYLANKDSISADQQRLVDFELGIICFYIDKKREGRNAINRLLLSPPADSNLEIATRHNLLFYLQSIETLKEIKLQAPVPKGFHCLNPSIICYDGNYLVNIRATNGIRIDGRWYATDNSNFIMSKNYVQLLDADLNPIWTRPLPDLEGTNAMFRGAEDIRLADDNGILFTCTNFNNVHGMSRMWLGKLNVSDPVTMSTRLLESPFPLRFEKNWLYIPESSPKDTSDSGAEQVKGDKYLYNPWTIITEKEIVEQREPIGSLRCGAGPLRYRGGLLFVAHEVYYRNGHPGFPLYFHRFCLWNDEYRVSDPFCIHPDRLEYISGMCWHGDNLFLTFGVEDREAYLIEVERSTLDKLLDSALVV